MRTAPVLLVLSLAMAACSSSDPSLGGDGVSLAECSDDEISVEVSGGLDVKPEFSVPDDAPPCELVVEDVTVGDGDEARAGSTLQMHYVGISWSTGVQFDSSWDRGQPFSFALGAGQVISGWDQGVEGMKVGGRRTLIIPSDLGYGETGSGTIAGGETLLFVVDLVDVTKPPTCESRKVTTEGGSGIPVSVKGKKSEKPQISVPDQDPPCALQMIDLVDGKGAEATDSAQLEMQYVGKSWSTNEEFDASWDRGEPFRFQLGTGSVIPGWDQGILGMKEGGRRLLVIPYELGYGAQGSPPAIPAFETLVFVVDLIRVDPPA